MNLQLPMANSSDAMQRKSSVSVALRVVSFKNRGMAYLDVVLVEVWQLDRSIK